MSVRLVHCDSHGEKRPAYVCQHLFKTLDDGLARGVLWSRDEDECINAYCRECSERVEAAGGEWVGKAAAELGLKLICEGCFRRIADVNGILELQ
jgi:hypothetical protein